MGKITYIDLLAKYGIKSAHPGGLFLTKELLKSFKIDPDTCLLDVGCGTGQTSAYICKKYRCNVTAIDINKKMLERAAQRFKKEGIKIDLHEEDASKMKFSSNAFDILLSESVTVFTNAKQTIGEYYRVLRNEGTLVAIEMYAEVKMSEKDLNTINSVYGIEYLPDLEEWADMFTRAGFRDIKTYRINEKPTYRLTSLRMIKDFLPHLNVIKYFRKKIGYRIFICTK
ncbi:UNVERIFIED_CONTAM: ubiquinone/menaquinone biosynthesis C-methylase UbiE [Acetivibrio alkalicellulosi]